MLLSVPNYNFNWQRTYVLKEPRKLPAGTQVHVRNAWDNSPYNPHNPDPTKTIRWGEQTFEEMFFATLGYYRLMSSYSRWFDVVRSGESESSLPESREVLRCACSCWLSG